jgi:hypothetical protein
VTVDTEFIPATSEAKPEHSPIDVSSKAFWAQTSEQRDERFARLRAEDRSRTRSHPTPTTPATGR